MDGCTEDSCEFGVLLRSQFRIFLLCHLGSPQKKTIIQFRMFSFSFFFFSKCFLPSLRLSVWLINYLEVRFKLSNIWKFLKDFFLLVLIVFLWLSIWSISLNIPHGLEKNMYYAIVKWGSLRMLIRSSWLIVLLRTSISLLIFFLDCLITERWVLKSPSIIMNLPSSLFNCTHFCFTYFGYVSRCRCI